MKKILALILALCMVICLAACGGGGTPANNAANTTPANNSANVPANNSANVPANSTENTEDAYRGKVTGNVYVNIPMDLGIKLPSGWVIYNNEQIAQQQGITKEFFEGTSIEDLIDKTGGMMVFYASKDLGANNFNIILQKIGKYDVRISDEELFRSMESSLRAQMESAGMKVQKYETLKTIFRGEEKAVLHTELEYSGLLLQQYQIFLRVDEAYNAVITMTGSDKDEMFASITRADGSGMSKAPEISEPSESTPQEGGVNPVLGTISGNTYTNEVIGVRFTLPQSWMALSAEQIAAQNGYSVSELDKVDLSSNYVVFYGNNTKTGEAVNVLVNNNAAAMSGFSDEDLFNMVKSGTIGQMTQQGYNITTYEVVNKKVLGVDHGILHMDFEYQGVKLTQYQVWLRSGDYVMAFNGGGLTGEFSLDTFLSWFSKL